MTGQTPHSVAELDVLIVTALELEYKAAKKVLTRQGHSQGVATWTGHDENDTPFEQGTYITASGNSMTVALARPTRMGANSTLPVASTLIERLKPRCLAMCGVCAGNPDDVALGDVIIAETTYAYDEGKRKVRSFEGDHRQNPIINSWLRAAQDLRADELPSYGAATALDAKIWAFERLAAGGDPTRHPAWDRFFPDSRWRRSVQSWLRDGLVTRARQILKLTDEGEEFLNEHMFLKPGTPKKLPFNIVVGPMASGNVVVKDSVTWNKLKRYGVRSVVGLEMEAAAIGRAAYSVGLDRWIVAKGVMDHADPNKDDRYKRFAALASAEVLSAFLEKTMAHKEPPGTRPVSAVRRVFVIGGITKVPKNGDARTLEADHLAHLCNKLGRALAEAEAELLVCSPFPGSADISVVMGYADAGIGGRINFHLPDHPMVRETLAELKGVLSNSDSVKIVTFEHAGPLIPPDHDKPNRASWAEAWRFSQLQALNQADAVIAIGGRVDGSAITTLNVADEKGVPILPFALLGGAAAHIHDHREWRTEEFKLLQSEEGIPRVVSLLERLVREKLLGPALPAVPSKTFFISRAFADAEFSTALEDLLKQRGLTPLMGDKERTPNRPILSAIDDAIRKSEVCIVLWSNRYASSKYCIRELEVALAQREKGLQVWLFNLERADVSHSVAQGLTKFYTPTVVSLRSLVEKML